MASQTVSNTEPNSSSLHEATTHTVELVTKHVPVASRRHLAIFLAFQLVVVAASGSRLPRLLAIQDQHRFHFHLACYYGTIIAFEFAQLLFVWYGIKKTNTTISDLV